MRCIVRTADKWQQEHPADLSRWLWQHDGAEAVVVDGNVYYCGTEALAQQYRDKWAAEGKYQDKRRTDTFLELDRKLFATEQPKPHIESPAWCESEMCLCAEIVNCTGACME